MDPTHIEQILRGSFNDCRLDEREDAELSRALVGVEWATLAFARNRALEMVADTVRGSASASALGWLKKVIKTIDAERERRTGKVAAAYFGPSDDCRQEITALLANVKKSVDACVFTITDNGIADAVMTAHERGVHVRIITDDLKAGDFGSDIEKLRRAGIAVLTDADPENHMHHKFAIFDRQLLATGSFNWTRSAGERNLENLVVTDNPVLVGKFAAEFDRLWARLGP